MKKLAILVLICGCGNSDDSDPDDGNGPPVAPNTSDPGTGHFEVSHTVSTVIPTVVTVTWNGDQNGVHHVEYGLTPEYGTRTPSQQGGTLVEILLLGLRAGTTVHYRGVTEMPNGGKLFGSARTVILDPLPGDLEPLTQTIVPDSPNVSQVQHGFMVGSQQQPDGVSWVTILDGAARIVWFARADPGTRVESVRPSADGASLLYLQVDADPTQHNGKIVRISLDGSEREETAAPRAHSDFVQLPDGTLAWLAREDDPGGNDVVADAIREAAPGSQATTTWSWFEDYPAEIWDICSHMDAGPGTPGMRDWSGANALLYDGDSDTWLVGSRIQDSLLRIPRAGGEPLWQMNGRFGQFTLSDGQTNPWSDVGDSVLWNHGRTTQFWDGGFVLFDTGSHSLDQTARAAEFFADEQGLVVEKIWEYTDPGSGFTDMPGTVTRLTSGDYFVNWGSMGRIDEITFDEQVRWQAFYGANVLPGRITWIADIYTLE